MWDRTVTAGPWCCSPNPTSANIPVPAFSVNLNNRLLSKSCHLRPVKKVRRGVAYGLAPTTSNPQSRAARLRDEVDLERSRIIDCRAARYEGRRSVGASLPDCPCRAIPRFRRAPVCCSLPSRASAAPDRLAACRVRWRTPLSPLIARIVNVAGVEARHAVALKEPSLIVAGRSTVASRRLLLRRPKLS